MGAPKLYTPEMIEWLKVNAPGKNWELIRQEFNRHFNLSVTKHSIHNQAKLYKIRNGIGTSFRRDYARILTEEEEKIFCANNWHKTKEEMIQFCKENFNKELSLMQIKGLRSRLHLNSGLDGKFKKGHHPTWNKVFSEESKKKMEKTFFKKGCTPLNYKKLYSVVLRQNLYWIKATDTGNPPKDWKLYHRFIYEQIFGELKENEIVTFLDGNTKNCSLYNLMKITKSENMTINNLYGSTENPELKKLIAATVRLNKKIKETKKC